MASSNSFTSPSESNIVFRYFIHKSWSSIGKCFSDRYFKANIVYLVYSLLLLHIDLNIGRESASDTFYILLGYMHILNAILYIWMWSEIRSVWNVYILPDWLNIFGSLLYWLSASQYIYDQPHALLTVRRIQLFASCIEVLATIGWCVQWYCEYNADLINIPLSCIGRGFTLDDPDIWGLISLTVATAYYLKYNAVMYFNLEEEAPSSLYVAGDCWYVVNAAVYTLCAMRDNECFWFMPVHGKPQCLIDIARAHYYSEGIGGRDRDREGVTDCLIASPKAKSVGKGSKKSRGRSDSLDSTDSASNGDGSTSLNHSPCTLSRSPSPANGSAEGTRERGKGGLENSMENLSKKFLMGSAVSGSVNLRSLSVSSNGNVSNSSSSNSNGSGSGNVNCSAQSSSREREREGSSKDSVKDSSSSSSSSGVSGSIGGVGASLFSIAGYTRRNE